MKQRIITVLSCIISILVIVFVAFNVIIYNEYKDILKKEISREMLLWAEDDNLCFTVPDKMSSGFMHNTSYGKTSKINSEVAYKNIKYEDNKFRCVKDLQKGIYCINKGNGEIYYIFDLQKEKENDGFADGYGITSVDVSSMYSYNNKLYFFQIVSLRMQNNSETKRKFLSFDPFTNTLTEILVPENVIGINESKNILYFEQQEKEKNTLKSFNVNTGEETEIAGYFGCSLYNVYPYKNGIYYLSHKKETQNCTLNTYNTATKEIKKCELPNGLVTNVLYSEKENKFFVLFDNDSYCVLSEEFNKEVSLKQMPEYPFKPQLAHTTPIIEINGKLYFGLYSPWSGDDAYVVYGMDLEGILEMVKKQDTSFIIKILLKILKKKEG